MTHLNRALLDIRNIRRQVAQNTEFLGYGPLTLTATAVFAFIGGVVQSYWIPEPASHHPEYVALWLTIGVVSAALILTQTLRRANRLHSDMADAMIRMALAQFLPAALAGVILPFLLLHTSRAVFWILPGLWQIVFSLGIFASCRCLPRPMLLAGAWFLIAGLLCVSRGDARALAPGTMSYVYGFGMAMVAAIHYLTARKEAVNEEK